MATGESKILTEFRLCDLKLELERRSRATSLNVDNVIDLIKRLDEALLNIEQHLYTSPGTSQELTVCRDRQISINSNDDYQDCWDESCFNENRANNENINTNEESFLKELKAMNLDFEHNINKSYCGETKDSLNLPMDEGEKIKIDNKDTQEIKPTDDDVTGKQPANVSNEKYCTGNEACTIGMHERIHFGDVQTAPSLKTVDVVDTKSKCVAAIKRILTDCSDHQIVGFYSEWVLRRFTHERFSKHGKVPIVSIYTPRGYCALFRMNKFSRIPKCLRDLLEKTDIVKAGIKIQTDARYLASDYGIRMCKFCDVREALIIKNKKLISRTLTKQILHLYRERIVTDFNHSRWLDEELTIDAIKYAAKHTYACLLIYSQINPKICITDITARE